MSNQNLPHLPEGFEYRLDLQYHVTPKLLKKQPIHRWFWFPHSFSPQLIDKILETFPIPEGGRILDPFVGAGTTVLRAAQLEYEATGTDLSPLSLFVSRVKLARLSKGDLETALSVLADYIPAKEWEALPERLRKAFTYQELSHLMGIQQKLKELPGSLSDFFRLVLLRVLQRVSRAVPDGGWFRWINKDDQSTFIKNWFEEQARQQIEEVDKIPINRNEVFCDDARQLKQVEGPYDLVVTSPPYPNRHDYSRVFHIELLWLGANEDTVKQFRKTSIRSHVEAASPSFSLEDYKIPSALEEVLHALPEDTDPRVIRMLQGYFEDMYLVLKRLQYLLASGAICAFVIGNVRHAGVMVPVDVILGEIAAYLGYKLETAWVVRLRGNSAQQMGKFGRKAARESIVFLRKL